MVQRRGWLDDQQFLSGYALSQLVPGATNVNLAVFIGTQMRGATGALVALRRPDCWCRWPSCWSLGTFYFAARGAPGGHWLSMALAGMGAVAIGLNLGTGIRLARSNIRRLVPALIAAAIVVGIGILGFPLLQVLLVMLPVSLALTLWQRTP